MNTLKSIGAVTAGFLTVVVLTSLTDAIMVVTKIFPAKPEDYTTGLLLLALIYRTLYAVGAGFVTAKLAPTKLMKHVIVLAAIGVLTGLAGVISGWNQIGYPHWYSITLTVLTFPAIWYGGKLFGDKK